MSIAEDRIINSYLKLNQFDKQLVSISIADAVKPLVYNLNYSELTYLYDYYLNMLWEFEYIDKNVIKECKIKMDVFFYQQEFDETSYSSYADPNFRLYLAYIGKESLVNCLESNKDLYGRVNIISFINISTILDDYYYHTYTKKLMSNKLEFILNQVAERKYEYSCINMLESIIEVCNSNTGSKNNVRKYIDLYTSNVESLLSLKV